MMQSIDLILGSLSGIAFVFYGLDCILSKKMIQEFERYQLSRFRILTGTLEVLGGMGSIAGLFWQPLLLLSSLGLCALMALGLVTRIRLRDPFSAMIPALVLFLLNLRLIVVSFAIL